ncbi:MmcQ/YjbR family DNA-binding protein [uncultured Phenylobacterium sp.]|uniref:MmcQ/YjbR family DNA-binding protein n=1 Tax=uncultured Phenylobacterium sp. TaxID=349273 RepID=UPI0025F3663B|nr:MmcQ/YjbR family DNA-binding protein [uncultured Phenylobacterium sp.]
MLTHDDVRAAALAQPEAYEASHFDVQDFRVNKKIFCTLHADVSRAVLKFSPEDQHNLLDGDALQRPEDRWGLKGWTYLYYERLDPARLPGLIRLAWATVAPKRLLKSGSQAA